MFTNKTKQITLMYTTSLTLLSTVIQMHSWTP